MTLIPIISCNRFGQYYTVYQQSTNIIHRRRRWMTDTIVITRFALLFIYYKIQIRSTIYSNIIFHYSIFSMNTRIVIWSKKTTYEKYFSVLSEARISIEYISMSNGLIFVWWWACEQYDCLSWLALLIVCVLYHSVIYILRCSADSRWQCWRHTPTTTNFLLSRFSNHKFDTLDVLSMYGTFCAWETNWYVLGPQFAIRWINMLLHLWQR